MSARHAAQLITGAPGSESNRDFNALRVPNGYVPGLGRGASGFTTRSDIGPARVTVDMPTAGEGQAPGAPPKKADKAGDDGGDAVPDENKFDEFMGADGALLAGTTGEYDKDDREADEVWAQIDEFMDNRRRDRREAKLKEEIEKHRKENPKITEQFADLKRKLSEISEDEWQAIPEIGDYTIKNKQKRQSFAPVPDTLLAQAMNEKQTNTEVGAGLDTPAGYATTDLTAVGEGRNTVVRLNLDRAGDSVSGQTVVDPKGYLTDLNSMKVSSDAEISDIKKARLLLKSVTTTNPRHAPGWIAAARLEELAGKLSQARQLLKTGCEFCPNSEDVWLEAARLQPPDMAKAVLAQGVAANPLSIALWLQAARLEHDDAAKARVLRRALERIPNSVKLWKAAVELANERDARILLARAVECCPQHTELWLALARLSTHDEARKILNKAGDDCLDTVAVPGPTFGAAAAVQPNPDLHRDRSPAPSASTLNTLGAASGAMPDNGPVPSLILTLERLWKAREEIPADPTIWFAAAKLEEAQGNAGLAATIINRAPAKLRKNNGVVSRDDWLKEAEACERLDPPMIATCQALVSTVIGLGVEPEDRKRTWMADADELLKRGSVETARAIYKKACEDFPGKKSVWRRAAECEKAHGTQESLDELLARAVKFCPHAEVLWLMWAKERWMAGDVHAAREILRQAHAAKADSEAIWLAAFKLEFENKEPHRARVLLQKARDSQVQTQRVWMKSAIVERELGNTEEEQRLLEEALQRFPAFDKLWLMLGQLEERRGRLAAARTAYQNGLKRCIHSVPLWRSAARLEEQGGSVARARALLEQGRSKNLKEPDIWLAAVRTEQRAGLPKAADALMAKALQENPTSGVLWAEAISMAPRPQRRAKSVDALKRCNDDPHIIAAVAQLFKNDGKTEKARNWFRRAVLLDPDVGDFWALLYNFEAAAKPTTADTVDDRDKRVAEVIRQCIAAQPRHGERWQRVAKRLENAHKSTEAILKLVAADILAEPPP